jgi:hypothetical protein
VANFNERFLKCERENSQILRKYHQCIVEKAGYLEKLKRKLLVYTVNSTVWLYGGTVGKLGQ